jgi:3-hydroxyisobutyrate dehydrogenase
MMLKDLRLAEAAADSAGATVALGRQAARLYHEFVVGSRGGLDFSAIIQLFQEPCDANPEKSSPPSTKN